MARYDHAPEQCQGFLAKEEMFRRNMIAGCATITRFCTMPRGSLPEQAILKTLDVRGIARDALNAVKPIDADE